MAGKPQLKTEVAVRYVYQPTKLISFYATPDAIADFSDFGLIDKFTNYYNLLVDDRYSFEEVLEYIQQYDRRDASER